MIDGKQSFAALSQLRNLDSLRLINKVATIENALSERRAQSVHEWLVSHGVIVGMAARGWGRSKPVAPNTMPNGADNPEGRQKNRRVEITFTTTQ